MKNLVVYDTVYGNTAKVAERFAEKFETKAVLVTAAEINAGEKIETLVIGSPTHGGRPTEAIVRFINSIPPESLSDKIRVICFDTRMDIRQQNFGLRLLMKTIGYAAEKMVAQIKKKFGINAETIVFYVEGKEGPLQEGV